MKCDKCREEVDERKGYVTIRTSFEANYSYRDMKGVLITNKATEPKRETKIHCFYCIHEAKDERS